MFDLSINNFSNYTLNETEEFVLKHGLKFYILPTRIKRELVFSVFKLLFVYLAKHKPTSIDGFITLKACLADLAHVDSGSNIDKSDFYLHHQHLNAGKSLCNNTAFVKSKPDNESGVVILNR